MDCRLWPDREDCAAVRSLALIVPLLLFFAVADTLLSHDRTVGWERNTVRNALARQATNKTSGVVLLGSSTSADWLPVALLARLTRHRATDVLDAHINGCHQPCTYAEVRGLLARERNFDLAFFGTSLFQACEYRHSKRQLQDALLLPTSDTARLFANYAHASEPLDYMARYLASLTSGAYGDTEVLQDGGRRSLFGAPTAKSWTWSSTVAPPSPPISSCDFTDEAIAYKLAVTAALLDDLGRLSKHTVLMLLPDATLSDPSPVHVERWIRFRQTHEALVSGRSWVTLLDLSTDAAADTAKDTFAHRPEHFRDGIHLSPAGMKLQQALLEKKLAASGVVP